MRWQAQERPPNSVSESSLATDAWYRDYAAVGEWSRAAKMQLGWLGEAHSCQLSQPPRARQAGSVPFSSGVAADGPTSRAIRDIGTH